MELSIPIVDCKVEESWSSSWSSQSLSSSPSSVGKKKQPGSRTRRASKKSASSSDINVQLCINSYLHPEILDGDNQYECSRCQKKCNATRRMLFAKLPPVLNIQLARYVFDRETFSKRKLTTKVRLPKLLEIPNSATFEGHMHAKYVLCAVQNHLGSSAHGGHYTADVMDWTTGVWYEFNDEDVTILEGGPTCSFDPDMETEEEDGTETTTTDRRHRPTTKRHHRKVGGSEDAYNLFYVEEGYLSMQCERELRSPFHCGKSEVNAQSSGSGSTAPGDCEDILTFVDDRRKERYRLELEIKTKNMREDARISARREKILRNVFLRTSTPADPAEGNSIWVESNFLRRFFSCRDGMADIFQSASNSSAFIEARSFLCLCERSKGLHPRVARRGKLLRPEVYGAVESIMQEEHAMFLRDQDSDSLLSPPLPLTDHMFIEGSNLICKDCGLSYQKEARRKYGLFKTLLSVHDDLIAGKNDLDPLAVLNSSSVYAISRTWATSFKKYVEKKVNELQSLPPKKCDANSNMPSGGIDILDLSEVMVAEDGEASEKNDDQSSTNLTKTSDSFKGEDPTSKITCHHGCCPMMNSGKSVRLIPENVWRNIAKVFTTAIAHDFVSPREDRIGNCAECYREKEKERLFPQEVTEWTSKITQTPGALSELLKRGKRTNQFFPSSEIELVLQHDAGNSFSLYALHHTDVQRWRDSFTAIEKSLKSRKKNDSLKKQLNELLFVFSESSQLGREWKFRQLTCKKHKRAVGLPSLSDKEDVKNWLDKLAESNVELLLREEYQELFKSLSTLESILHGDGAASLNESQPPSVSIKLQKGIPKIHFVPQLCTSGCGVTSFADESIENGPVKSKTRRAKPLKETELIDEGSKGPLCKVFVHKVENDMAIDVSASQIAVAMSNDNDPLIPSNGRPRRSRKARGEGGGSGFPVHEIEMALDGNLAHFRLLLHQSKTEQLFGQRLFLLRVEHSVFEEQTEELTHKSDLKTIHEIISGTTSLSQSSNPETQTNCTAHFILSYRSADPDNSDGMRRSPRKRMSQEEKKEDQHLLLSLTDIACGGWMTADASDVVAKGKKPKRRRQERGFQGTFLHQSSEYDVPDDPLPPDNAEVSETLDNDDSEDVVIVHDSPQDDEDVASANKNDDRAYRRRQKVDEELTKAVQAISNCTQGLDRDALKEQILSKVNPDEVEMASSIVRQTLMDHINAHLKDIG
mmetsp:Transcript_20083/g.42088  ORF Transcript_20083/g.42088 Transcript_20083/m.42088 type:complete len:1210 (+) Transcript_20083:2-3631(+)